MNIKSALRTITLLSAVLALQTKAFALGAVGSACVERTRSALTEQLVMLPEVLNPPTHVVTPETVAADIEIEEDWEPELGESVMAASRCRALLLEVIRRAAHDWVLYRNTRKPERAYAMDAYVWLFEEREGHKNWEARKQEEGGTLMAFETICEMLDLDPEFVRRRVRAMTVKDIMTSGRPAESRKARQEGVEDYSSPSGVDMHALEFPTAPPVEYDSFAAQPRSSY